MDIKIVLIICLIAHVAFSSECTPTYISASCTRTSSCPLASSARRQSSNSATLLSSLNYRYNLEHVERVMNRFKTKINELKRSLLDIISAWEGSTHSVSVGDRGLSRLYPVHSNNPGIEDIHSGISHSSVLAELRWWLTAVEEQVIQLKACGFLGPTDGPGLLAKVSTLSRDLNSLLRLISIEPRDFTAQALCAQVPNAITDSATKRARFTSVALRDLQRAINRIKAVLDDCMITPHTEGQHLVQLECQNSHQHLFYQSLPSDISHLYSQMHFLNGD
ncbi:hypothetical protein RRG08_006683 [Elysia crispata]|uniref:Uncharacterized protein n=1 Tax=Elysia crispata TaxID=231223 RepID=A0AAE0YVL8_9GAST|nr:hypothetical protein RRG08_006683 [Elysia crispata]